MPIDGSVPLKLQKKLKNARKSAADNLFSTLYQHISTLWYEWYEWICFDMNEAENENMIVYCRKSITCN